MRRMKEMHAPMCQVDVVTRRLENQDITRDIALQKVSLVFILI